LSESVARRLREGAGPCVRIVTKRPEDFWNLGLIGILFPKARIIHCRRHPIDTCLSCYMQNFWLVPYATKLEELAEVYRLYRRITDHWWSVLSPERVCEVSYEDLVERPEDIVRRLCGFCGVPFEAKCLHFDQNPRRVYTASRWQVRRPLYGTSVGRWKAYREMLGPLLTLEKFAADQVTMHGRTEGPNGAENNPLGM
jgi:hypothetical protein